MIFFAKQEHKDQAPDVRDKIIKDLELKNQNQKDLIIGLSNKILALRLNIYGGKTEDAKDAEEYEKLAESKLLLCEKIEMAVFKMFVRLSKTHTSYFVRNFEHPLSALLNYNGEGGFKEKSQDIIFEEQDRIARILGLSEFYTT